MENCIDYEEIVILTVLGERIIELLPKKEGYFFSKKALKLCWKWIEEQQIEIGDLYDCLDSPEGVDFSYYEEIAEGEEERKIYRCLFYILAYITDKISIMQKINRPQYLDFICEDSFEKVIKAVTDDYCYIEKMDGENKMIDRIYK